MAADLSRTIFLWKILDHSSRGKVPALGRDLPSPAACGGWLWANRAVVFLKPPFEIRRRLVDRFATFGGKPVG